MATQPFGVQFGYATDTTVKVMGCSLSNSNIVITADNGATVTLSSMTELGTDSGDGGKPRAGYTDSGVLTGLTSFTNHSWTAVQDGNTITGTTLTNPGVDDDFCIFHVTCEANNYQGSVNDEHMWTAIRAHVESSDSLPCAGIMHVDDHGYWDFNGVDDGTYAVTGVPHTTAKVYDYALGAFANYGVYASTGNAYCTYGQDEDRLWGKRNLNLIAQLGDHDCGANDMGWQIDPAVGGLTQFTNSKAVWDAFMLPLQPPATTQAAANGTNSWMCDIGCITVGAMDGVSQGSGDGTIVPYAAPTTIYSSAGINDILTDFNSSTNWFKFMLMDHSIKRMDGGSSGNSGLAQNYLSLHTAEYQQLLTATGNSPKSLMDNPKTNGIHGSMCLLHGDFHVANIIKHEKAAYSGNARENWTSITAATMNEQATNVINEAIIEGYTYDGSTVEFMDKTATYWAVRLDVYGSLPLKEVHIYFLDKNGNSVWAGKLVEKRGGNEFHATDADLSLISSSGGSGL